MYQLKFRKLLVGLQKLLVDDSNCPRDSFLHYYACCDDNPYQCCFHFETWAVRVMYNTDQRSYWSKIGVAVAFLTVILLGSLAPITKNEGIEGLVESKVKPVAIRDSGFGGPGAIAALH
ncbi:hypothetical protein COOONC_16581 [Cooperia oncophora]